MVRLVGNWGHGEVWQITSGRFPSNAYVCTDADSRDCLLVDGGLDPEFIDNTIQNMGLHPILACCTHAHFDHAGSAAWFQHRYGLPVYLHHADQKILKAANFMLMAFKIGGKIDLPEVTWVHTPAPCSFAKQALLFHHAPGHTPGSCIVQLGTALFTGDTVYARHVGLSRLPGENPQQLRESILGLWPLIDTPHRVHPGHGPSTDGADIRQNNLELVDFLGLSTCTLN